MARRQEVEAKPHSLACMGMLLGAALLLFAGTLDFTSSQPSQFEANVEFLSAARRLEDAATTATEATATATTAETTAETATAAAESGTATVATATADTAAATAATEAAAAETAAAAATTETTDDTAAAAETSAATEETAAAAAETAAAATTATTDTAVTAAPTASTTEEESFDLTFAPVVDPDAATDAPTVAATTAAATAAPTVATVAATVAATTAAATTAAATTAAATAAPTVATEVPTAAPTAVPTAATSVIPTAAAPVVGDVAVTPAPVVQAAGLLHAGEDCFNDCWKTAGFCDYCGTGMACCTEGDNDDDPLECQGPLTYLAKGEFAECVVPAFQPGDKPPVEEVGEVATMGESQCISYMAENDCGWTNQKSCPNQPTGLSGEAPKDDSIAYLCCCENGLWRESATLSDAPHSEASSEPAVPTQVTASTTAAVAALPIVGSTTPMFSVPVDSVEDGLGLPTVPSATAATESAEAGAATDALGAAIAPTATTEEAVAAPASTGLDQLAGASLDSHAGPNVHVQTMQMGDADFEPTAHHGPINNEFSANSNKARKEKCTFGICADLDLNDPDTPATAQTAEGLDEPSVASILPSYRVSVEEKKLKVRAIEDGVSSAVTPTAPPVVTESVMPIAAGSNVVEVANANEFAVGDKIVIGNREEKTVVDVQLGTPEGQAEAAGVASARLLARQKSGETPMNIRKLTDAAKPALVLDTAVDETFPSGTSIVREPTPSLLKAAVTTPAPEAASSSSGADNRVGVLIGIVAGICCCLLVAGGAAAFLLSNKKNKGRRATDREDYMKNDFIERQPVYHEVPSAPLEMASVAVDVNGDGIADAIVTGVDRNHDGIPDALQAPPPLMPAYQPLNLGMTQPVGGPTLASFPGMPNIASGAPMLTRPSMQLAGNYGGAPFQNQLGMTGPLTQFQQPGGVI